MCTKYQLIFILVPFLYAANLCDYDVLLHISVISISCSTVGPLHHSFCDPSSSHWLSDLHISTCQSFLVIHLWFVFPHTSHSLFSDSLSACFWNKFFLNLHNLKSIVFCLDLDFQWNSIDAYLNLLHLNLDLSWMQCISWLTRKVPRDLSSVNDISYPSIKAHTWPWSFNYLLKYFAGALKCYSLTDSFVFEHWDYLWDRKKIKPQNGLGWKGS